MNAMKWSILLLVFLSTDMIGQYDCLPFQKSAFQSTKSATVYGPDGRLYIPTLKGLLMYDGQEIKMLSQGNEDSTIVRQAVRNIHFSSDSTIWILYSNGGYSQIKKDTVIHKVDVGGASDHLCFSITEYRGILYLCTNNGVYAFTEGQFRLLISPEARGIQTYHQGKLTNDIRRIHISKDDPNILWLSGGGLYKYDLRNDELNFITIPSRFLKDFGDYTGKTNTYLLNDFLETDNAFYLTSWGGGLFEITKSNMSWKQYLLTSYKDNHPLNENILFEMETFRDGKMLCGAIKDFVIFDTGEGTFDYSRDVFPALNLVAKGTVRLKKLMDKIVLSSYNDLCFINSDKPNTSVSSQSNKIILKDVLIDGRSVKSGNHFYPRFVHNFKKYQRNITFRYSLPSPLNNYEKSYAYRLKGRNKNWISQGDIDNISFADLNGGDAVLELRAKNANGEYVYSEPFEFSIDKYIYEEWWFWLLVALSISGIVALMITIKWNQHKKEKALEAKYNHELAKLEMSALRAQMNPHFLFNSLNSIKNFALTKGPKETASYLTKFSHLIRLILQNSKNPMVHLKDELEALKLYVEIEALRFENKFRFKFTVDDGLTINSILIPPLILQPYVENAIWHGLMHKKGTDGLLSISVKDLGDHIQCMIEDNGIGREKAKAIKKQKIYTKQKSLGMEITNDRIELTNKIYNIKTKVQVVDLYGSDGSPSGTRVLLNIPKSMG